jgi:hypothetical protein
VALAAEQRVHIADAQNGVENFQIARRPRGMSDNPMPQGADPPWRENS